MRITIRERSYEYQSDYPHGWRFAAGDYFKFPVRIGLELCFVKRFEKETSQVEGWELLTRLKGRYAGNTPRIHDTATVTENGRAVHYVFYQYVEGNTLDRVLAEGTMVDLSRLTNDLVAGLRVIHEHGFWFTDFTEKNIFCAKGGSFLLLDLDSAQPAAKRPADARYGDREYWTLVFDFYTQEMQCRHFRAADLRGAALDYLQIPFLILRLQLYFNSAQGEEPAYKSEAMRDRLRTVLSQADPGFKELFGNALEKEGRLLTPREIEQLTQLIEQRIIHPPNPLPVRPPDPSPDPPPDGLLTVTPPVLPPKKVAPVIKDFGLTRREAERGELFAVYWKVAGAETVELYRNGKLLNTTAAGEGQLARSEFHADDQAVHYYLVALNEAGLAETQPVVLHCKPQLNHQGGPKPVVRVPVKIQEPVTRQLLVCIRKFIGKFRAAGLPQRKELAKALLTSDAFQLLLIAFAVLVTLLYLLIGY